MERLFQGGRLMGTDSSNDKQVKQSLFLRFTIIGVVYATISYAFVALVLAFLGRGNASPKVSIWIVALYWGICGGVGGFLWGLICASRAIWVAYRTSKIRRSMERSCGRRSQVWHSPWSLHGGIILGSP
jgi:hypothetical protein